jgi:hypothetical protein
MAMPEKYIVYMHTDEEGRVAAVNSSGFLTDLTDWIAVDEGVGDRYHHAQGNYLDKPLYDEHDRLNYKLENGKAVERTEEEKANDEQPMAAASELEKLEAQVIYTAMMTDTLMGE